MVDLFLFAAVKSMMGPPMVLNPLPKSKDLDRGGLSFYELFNMGISLVFGV